jgi:phosphatidate cytidylyltransferase
MLRTRIITALVLIVLALGALFLLPDALWGLLLLAITLAAAWEWADIAIMGRVEKWIFVAIAGAAGWVVLLELARLTMTNPPGTSGAVTGLYWAAGVFWAAVVPLWLARRLARPRWAAGLAGLMVLVPTLAALVHLRALGPWLLLGYMATIWISDSAAYFAGRRFGRRKLAPSVSPGKTWEGVAGAMAAVAAYGLAWGGAGLGKSGLALAGFVALLLLLAVLGILGDLFESLMKRDAGVKDSGRILPGHGGILDRIDALTAALPVAALVALHA